MVVHGKDEAEHNENLRNFLKRTKQMRVVLSRDRCSICVEEIDWFGLRFGQEGMREDPVKIEHLSNCQPPKTTEEVRNCLQAAQFMYESKEAYASVTYPLRQMLKQNAKYKVGRKEE